MTTHFVKPNASPKPWGTPAVSQPFEELANFLQAIREIDLVALTRDEREKLINFLRVLHEQVLKKLQEFLSLQMELEALQVTSALSNATK